MRWLSRQRREEELEEEIRSHLAMAERDRTERGESASEAAAAARREFGNIGLVKEVTREIWGAGSLERLGQDLRFAARGFARAPGFAAVATLTLALGIGCCAAIFTFVDTLLLRPLPYRDPERLVMVWEAYAQKNFADNVVSPANYLDWRARNHVFEQTAALYQDRVVIQEGGEPAELPAQAITASLLPMLGVKSWRGRLFEAGDVRMGAPAVILISYRLWQARFGGEESAVGRRVTIDSQPATIVGVLPPGFHFLDRDVELWQPLGFNPSRDYRKDSGRYLLSAARLRRGVSAEAAGNEMNAIAAALEREYPWFDTGWRVNVVPLREELVKNTRTSLLLLSAAVALLLLIACANVANLLLARGTAREQELALRAALGAGRARLVRQLLTEAAALGLAAAAIGVALARVLLKALLELSPTLDAAGEYAIDGRVLGFALALALVTAAGFGMAPAFSASGADAADRLRQSGRAVARSGRRLREGFVVAQVALTAVLLVCAGLLLRSFVRLEGERPGLAADHLLTARVSLPGSKYDASHRVAFFRDTLEAVRALPGVRGAAAVSYLPFTGLDAATDLRIAGRPPARPGEEPGTIVRTVTPGYFRSMGIPVFEGRDFNEGDNTASSTLCFIVNRAFAEAYFKNQPPLEQSISVHMRGENPFARVIGVVGDVREGALDQPPAPTAYYVHAHLPYPTMTLVVKTVGEPLSYAGALRRLVRRMDPAQPVAAVRSMEEVLRETLVKQRLNALVTLAFAIAAILLAAVGLYGILSHSVGERTREFGIRMALGARPGSLVASVVGQGVLVCSLGLAVGIAAACAATRLLSKLLFGVTPLDAATFAGAAAVLLAAGAAAAFVPARRATRVDPVIALRAE